MVSFIGGGNPSTRKKPPTYRKSLTNFIMFCICKKANKSLIFGPAFKGEKKKVHRSSESLAEMAKIKDLEREVKRKYIRVSV
jgi:hypothetical protein